MSLQVEDSRKVAETIVGTTGGLYQSANHGLRTPEKAEKPVRMWRSAGQRIWKAFSAR